MRLPSDRADLLRLANKGERALAEIQSAGNPKAAGRRAATMFELGRVRDRLGDLTLIVTSKPPLPTHELSNGSKPKRRKTV